MRRQPAGTTPRLWFEQWWDPDEFYEHAQVTVGTIPLNEALPQYVRDAYVAGVFARIWRDAEGTCEVRLVSQKEQFPDAQLRTAGTLLDLEIVVADKKDRPMWKEHRDWAEMYTRGKMPANESPDVKRSHATEAIPRVCKQKAEKRYKGQRSTHLLIYVNAGPVLTAPEMVRLTEPCKDAFASIYLICGMDAVMAWPTMRVLRGKHAL